MTQPAQLDYNHRLRSLMQAVNLSSFKALSQKAGVSEWQVKQLRQGQASQMRVENLLKLSQALDVEVAILLRDFADIPMAHADMPMAHNEVPQTDANQTVADLKQEYERLQTQLTQQQGTLQQEFQQSSLQVLESWLLQWPTAAYAAQQNPQIPATRLLPLIRPIEELLKQWQVQAIAPVGTEHPYDPQIHQLMDGTAQPGDLVKIRYTGYWQGEKLLYRAKVSPIKDEDRA
ncbi:MAG: helix-turn-helix transcriptional regulator [Cyanothece sp. SIO1E1]|nr:helix-turn-helix transcriptional regulator [Cyanothece sp. SIO1E1]